MNINIKHEDMLLQQFKDAMGMDDTVDLAKHGSDIRQWLLVQKILLNNYCELLNSTRFLPENELIVELGKSIEDSVTVGLEKMKYNVIAITPYYSTFDESKVKAYNGRFTYSNGEPFVVYKGKAVLPLNTLFSEYLGSNIRTLISQIPSENEHEINSMIKACNGPQDIILGSYGSLSDKGVARKIKTLEACKSAIENKYGMSVDEEFVTMNERYYHIIKSNSKQKKHVKSIGI